MYMPEIVPEEITMELMAPDHHEIPFDFTVDKVDDEHCQIIFVPDIECECEGQLKYAGEPVGEPFKLPIGDPTKCKACGPGIEEDQLSTDKETFFTVDSTEAGPGTPKVEVTGPNDSKIKPTCTEEKPGVNRYTYTPEKGGPHEVSVLFGGHDIPGSPFHVPVCNPSGVKCAPNIPEKVSYRPGEEIILNVDLKDAGEGDFNLGLVGPDNTPIVSEDAVIAFVPMDEEAIDGNTEVIQLKPEGPKVGSKIPYKIDTSDVETGDVITGKVVGPFSSKKNLPKKLLSDKITTASLPTLVEDKPIIEPAVKEENKIYDVDFTPEEVGVYLLYVFLGDNLVNDMPTILVVSDPQKIVATGPGLGDTEGNTYPKDEPLIWEVDCTKAGPGSVTAYCAGPDDCSKKFKVSPISGKPDCYTVKYKPKKAGPYQVLLAFGGYETPYKPTFNVSKPSLLALLFGKLKGDKETPEESSPEETAPQPKQGNIRQTKNDDGTYTVGFIPDEPGLYEFTPTIGDSPVFEEPLTVLVTDPDKVEVTGPSLTGQGARAGKPTEITVDRTDAGPAPVEGVLSLPSGEKQPLDFQPKDESTPDVLSATLTPEQPGEYPLDVKFGGKPLPESPFPIKVVDDKTVTFDGPGLDSAAIDEENVIDMYMPEIVPEEITMELMAPDHAEVPFDFFVDKVDDDHCQLRFTPPDEGDFAGQLKYAGEPVGEPFTLPIGNPKKCAASGPGIEESTLPVGEETFFTVDSSEAGPGIPKVTVQGPNETQVEPVCTEEKPGVRKYKYTPVNGGLHEIEVLFGGHNIPGSPFNVPIVNPAGVKCTPVNSDKPLRPGDEILLTIDLKDAGNGDFNLGLTGPNNKPIVSKDAVISLIPVDESSFDVPVQPKPQGPNLGATVPYKINSTDGDTKEPITGKVVGPFPNKMKIPKKLLSNRITPKSLPESTNGENIFTPEVKVNDDVFDVLFTPENIGIYVLYIFAGDKLTDNMPCIMTVCDPNNVKVTGPGLGDEENNEYPTSSPLVWNVYCSQAGTGELAAYCDAGPEDSSKTFKILPITDQINSYYVEYYPNKDGEYKIWFAYGGYEVSYKPTFKAVSSKAAAPITKDTVVSDHLPVEEIATLKPQDGKLESSIDDNGKATFKFTPRKPGLYQVMPTMEDYPVLHEPVPILVTDPNKVKVFGPGVTGKGLCIGKPTEVFLDRTDSGPGPVKGVLSTPSGEMERIEFEPKDKEEDIPNVLVGRYTPQISGFHSLSITFDNQSLPLGPIRAFVVDPNDFKLEGGGIKEATVGKINNIDCLLENMPDDGVFSMVTEDKNGEVEPLECEIIKVNDEECSIQFMPDTEDACYAVLQFNDVPITNKIALSPNNIDGAEIIGLKQGQGVVVDKEKSFTANLSGCMPKAGQFSIQIFQADGSQLEPILLEVGFNKYTIFMKPNVLGMLQIILRFGDQEMVYTVFVVDPSAVICTGLGGESTLVSEKQVFAIDTTAAGVGARLKIELEGKDGGEISCKHMINHNYSGVLSVLLAGTYYVHIYYGGYKIAGSPFECNFHRLEPDASQCAVSDFLSTPGKFTIDCRNAGGLGVIEVACYGAYVPARYIGLEHNGDYTFNIDYDIPDPVETFISVKWHGEHLAGSPFKVAF